MVVAFLPRQTLYRTTACGVAWYTTSPSLIDSQEGVRARSPSAPAGVWLLLGAGLPKRALGTFILWCWAWWWPPAHGARSRSLGCHSNGCAWCQHWRNTACSAGACPVLPSQSWCLPHSQCHRDPFSEPVPQGLSHGPAPSHRGGKVSKGSQWERCEQPCSPAVVVGISVGLGTSCRAGSCGLVRMAPGRGGCFGVHGWHIDPSAAEQAVLHMRVQSHSGTDSDG